MTEEFSSTFHWTLMVQQTRKDEYLRQACIQTELVEAVCYRLNYDWDYGMYAECVHDQSCVLLAFYEPYKSKLPNNCMYDLTLTRLQ